MRKQANSRIFLGWLFAVLFMIPPVTQALHSYDTACEGATCTHTEDHAEHSNHDCRTCVVCKFMFSTFTEVALTVFETLQPQFYHPECTPYQERGYAAAISSYYLRGPPAV